jgi:hypothetical protein
MTALQFLRISRSHIDKRVKWTKFRLESPFGSYCSVGALQQTYILVNGHRPRAAGERNEWLEGDILAAAKYLAKALGVEDLAPAERLSYIANYNDAEAIHHDDVMAMWDRAIELAELDEIQAEVDTITVDELIEELASV